MEIRHSPAACSASVAPRSIASSSATIFHCVLARANLSQPQTNVVTAHRCETNAFQAETVEQDKVLGELSKPFVLIAFNSCHFPILLAGFVLLSSPLGVCVLARPCRL